MQFKHSSTLTGSSDYTTKQKQSICSYFNNVDLVHFGKVAGHGHPNDTAQYIQMIPQYIGIKLQKKTLIFEIDWFQLESVNTPRFLGLALCDEVSLQSNCAATTIGYWVA